MKRIKLAILFLLVLVWSVAYAALVKTTSIVELDAWQEVTAGTKTVGAAGNILGSYAIIMYLEIAYSDSGAANQNGVEVSIEVSYGDDDWTLLTTSFSTPASSSTLHILTDAEATAGTSIVNAGGNAGFHVPGFKWFIDDGANSESVRTKSGDFGFSDDIQLTHDLLYTHITETTITGPVYEYVFPIPVAFAYVRVLINNIDADAEIHFTTRLSKVTAL